MRDLRFGVLPHLLSSVLLLVACDPGKTDLDQSNANEESGGDDGDSGDASKDDDDDSKSGGDDGGDDGDDGKSGNDEDGESDEEGGESGDDPAAECQPGLEDGKCDEGHKCSPTLKTPDSTWTDTAHCVPLMGDQGFGDDCVRDKVEGNDDCDVNLFCFAGCTGCEGDGTCMQLCDASSPESQSDACQEVGLDASYYCFNFNEGFFPVCIATCHPIQQDCPEDQGCYQSADPEYMCSAFVAPDGGDGRQGDPCTLVQHCRPGLQCLAAESLAECDNTNCCAYNCDLDAEDPNALCEVDGEECIAMLEDPPPGKENVGICAMPTRNLQRVTASED